MLFDEILDASTKGRFSNGNNGEGYRYYYLLFETVGYDCRDFNISFLNGGRTGESSIFY